MTSTNLLLNPNFIMTELNTVSDHDLSMLSSRWPRWQMLWFLSKVFSSTWVRSWEGRYRQQLSHKSNQGSLGSLLSQKTVYNRHDASHQSGFWTTANEGHDLWTMMWGLARSSSSKVLYFSAVKTLSCLEVDTKLSFQAIQCQLIRDMLLIFRLFAYFCGLQSSSDSLTRTGKGQGGGMMHEKKDVFRYFYSTTTDESQQI